jgi:hypothetical protein
VFFGVDRIYPRLPVTELRVDSGVPF